VQYHILISSAAERRRFSRVDELLKEMESKRLVPLIDSLSVLAFNYLQGRLPKRALSVLDTARRLKIPPNLRFVSHCAVYSSPLQR
jgi:pentatricopeptide repeat protein